tara:strand:- start:287 stop:919 length:633 start_codon:yes stop_codon:yes gene_type:complete
MKKIEKIESFSELLSQDGVVEEFVLRSTFGICAIHGGGLERATEAVAREVAERTNSSYYAVIQPEGSRKHLSSRHFSAEKSEKLSLFLGNVDTVISIHGYGKDDDFWALLLGGTNRKLAHHLAGHLRELIPEEYRVVDQLEEIPLPLRGVHPNNPVNIPIHGGVQIEIPPGLRWNKDYNFWSDADGTPRAVELEKLIKSLVEGIEKWLKI